MSEYDLQADEERRVIENIASAVVEYGLETPAIMFLEATRPMAFIASQLAIMVLGPLQWLFQLESPKYTAVFMKKENVGKIIDRIEELAKSKSSLEQQL